MTPELPYETGGGGRPREYLLCRRLVENGHEVLNISPALPSEAREAAALREVGVENWIALRPRSHLLEAGGAVARDPAVLGRAFVAPVRGLEMQIFWLRLRDLVVRAVHEWRPDVVMVGHDMAARWAYGVPSSIPAVLTLHNLNWHWYLSRARRQRGLARAALRAEAARYRRYLLRLLPRYEAAVAVSTIEAEELRHLSQLAVSVIPSGLDTDKMRPAPEANGTPRLLFAATLDYQPNAEGIRWFVQKVWPHIRAELPAAKLDIVGRRPPASVLRLSDHESVTVVGPVPDMAPYFAHAHVAIVPIHTGAGMRVKIVEAMTRGRAVVSTSLGWEGLPWVEAGRHLLVADDPPQFAAATLRLLTDAGLRHRLATDARSLAEKRYDWRQLGDEQERVIRSVLRKPRCM
jgi:glycosyltransferase involved in cell wall biosynthesis